MIEAADLDRFGDFDRKSYGRQYSSAVSLLWGTLISHGGIRLSLNYSRHCQHGEFVDSLKIAMILHLGLEYSLMDQYLVSLSSLLKRQKRK